MSQARQLHTQVCKKLDKLVVLYDSNDINLDGETKDSFTESVRDRYNAYGWHTALVEDGTDLEAIHAAIETAKASGKPSLIEVKTVIGYGSPNKQGTNAVHGAPLGADETAATRQVLGWDYEPFESQNKYMLISKNMLQTVAHQLIKLGQN